MSEYANSDLEALSAPSMRACDCMMAMLSQAKRSARGFSAEHPETAAELLQALEIAHAAVMRLQAEIAAD